MSHESGQDTDTVTPELQPKSPDFPRALSLSVAVDPVSLVVSECINVTSAMRKHARWAHSSVSAILGGSSRPQSTQTRDGSGQSTPIGTPSGSEDVALAGRWGLRGKKGLSMQDNPLISAFARLRHDLKSCKDIKTFDTPALLHPFLQIIRSSSTSAPITSLALIAVAKFLSYNIINRDSPRLALAMQHIASTVTHCRFEQTDKVSEEIVLLRVLKVMESLIVGPCGDVLSDESVCQLLTCGLDMCCQARLSEVLRRSAEMAMVNMCQVIFERLKDLETEAGDEPGALDESTKDDMDTVKMDPSVNGDSLVASRNDEERPSSSLENPQEISGEAITPNADTIQVGTPHAATTTMTDEDPVIKPYSLPAIRELFRVLVEELLDLQDKQHPDALRVMALRIINVALEVAGPSVANHPSLAILAKDTLCRYLFQLVRSDNMFILNESLRVAGTLLATCRPVLKLQQELFLSYLVACLFPRVEIPLEPGINPALYEGVPQAPSLVKQPPSQTSSGRSTPVPVKDRQRLGLEGGARKPDAREAMVECVGALVRMPSFMIELFVNYDCEIDRSDLCSDMIGLLCRNAFPDSATWSTTNVPPLCLDALLSVVQFMAERLDDEPAAEGLPSVECLQEQRSRKKIIVRGATKFNEKPKAGIAFLASQGIIDNPDDPHAVAAFLKGTTRIDKKVLGEFLSKKDNGAILSAFMSAFDFTGLRVDEALRQLLNSFRLPGEAQLIERIVAEFADHYWDRAKPDRISDRDSVLVLTFAIIMLNTDQHNPNIKSQKRMTLEDFSRNLRGVNAGKDFDSEYMEEIFNSIKSREIILPEEHDNKHAYDHAWAELLVKAQSTSDLVICDTNAFDADMFAANWRPIVGTLSFVFMSASDDAVFSRIVTGFYQCAQIAARYGLCEALDRIIYCLSHISTLASDAPPSTALNTEVQADKKSVMVSETAVRFGRDERAQLASFVLMRIVNGNEAAIRDGWDYLLRIMLNLFVNSLIPPTFSTLQTTLNLPPIPLQNPIQVIDRERPSDTGLFSALSSYVSSFANDEPPEPSDQEIEYTLCTIDCVNACGFPEVFANISQMPIDSLRSLFDSLLAHVPEDSSPRVIMVKPELPSPRQNGKTRSVRPTYDPTLVFVLELATLLVLRDDETITALGKDIAGTLQDLTRDASNHHPVLISRAVYYLLNLLRASNDYDYIRAPVVLHTISSFDEHLLKQIASTLVKGIFICISGPLGLRNEMVNSPDFWVILNMLLAVPDAANDVFQIVQELTDAAIPGITADNYEALMHLLNEIATIGAIGAEEQRREHVPRRGKSVKAHPKTPEIVTRAVNAMNIVYHMTGRVPRFIAQSHLETNEAWNAYWSPIFKVLTTQCCNPCREIRQQAFNSLQRSLLSADLTSPDHKEWTAIFGEVLFPLISELLKPEVYQTDPVGMSDTRVQAATLLCKIFLHYLVALSEWEGMLDLWCRILGVMDRLMNSGQGDNLEEAVPESLKNILLVMSSGGYLAPPEEKPEQEELWRETWIRLDRFLPDLFAELFPEEAKKPLPVRPRASTGPVAESSKQGGEAKA